MRSLIAISLFSLKTARESASRSTKPLVAALGYVTIVIAPATKAHASPKDNSSKAHSIMLGQKK